jgi:4-amino-4-deoxy-L-arabinose transferase-like glycosyltransferase
LYAKENPKAWIFCGLFIGLGALQKAPVALLFVAVLFAHSSMRGDPAYKWPTLWRDKYFKAGFYLALILILSWPVIQTFKYGIDHFKVTYHQMFVRFSPVDLAPAKQKPILHHFAWLKWLWSDIHILSIVSGVCIISVFYFKKWRNSHALAGMCLIILITAITLSLATGDIYARYLSALLPLLVCVNVKVLNDVLSWKPGVFVAIIFFALLLPGNISDRFNPVNPPKPLEMGFKIQEVTKLISVLDKHVRETDRIVIDTTVMPEGAYGYFGNDAKSYYTLRVLLKGLDRKIESGNSSLVGIAKLSNRDSIEKVVGPVEALEIIDSFLIWRDEFP